jgi:hypothetical protein
LVEGNWRLFHVIVWIDKTSHASDVVIVAIVTIIIALLISVIIEALIVIKTTLLDVILLPGAIIIPLLN